MPAPGAAPRPRGPWCIYERARKGGGMWPATGNESAPGPARFTWVARGRPLVARSKPGCAACRAPGRPGLVGGRAGDPRVQGRWRLPALCAGQGGEAAGYPGSNPGCARVPWAGWLQIEGAVRVQIGGARRPSREGSSTWIGLGLGTKQRVPPRARRQRSRASLAGAGRRLQRMSAHARTATRPRFGRQPCRRPCRRPRVAFFSVCGWLRRYVASTPWQGGRMSVGRLGSPTRRRWARAWRPAFSGAA